MFGLELQHLRSSCKSSLITLPLAAASNTAPSSPPNHPIFSPTHPRFTSTLQRTPLHRRRPHRLRIARACHINISSFHESRQVGGEKEEELDHGRRSTEKESHGRKYMPSPTVVDTPVVNRLPPQRSRQHLEYPRRSQSAAQLNTYLAFGRLLDKLWMYS